MNSRKITGLTSREARNYFMKNSSYINFPIPEYFSFEALLTLISPSIMGKELVDICVVKDKKSDGPHNYDLINHVILSNKDGAYSWRPMQLIHPVLYIYLMRIMTEKKNWEEIQGRFKDFSKTFVDCISVPRESSDNQSDKASQIRDWWERIEQYSIKKSLEYNYLFLTDISDCYGSIYTHSIEWALDKHGKEEVKKRLREKKPFKTLGGKIDQILRMMNYNQTNGIPQGSTLTDFIAEIVLGYVDEQLTKLIIEHKIKKKDFHIVRYRDDYRIFVNDPNIGHLILKLLSSALYAIGLKMNASKTLDSNDVILSSIKREKLERISIAPAEQKLQKEALRIYQLSKKYPNSGLIAKELSLFFDKIENLKKFEEDPEILIVIFSMIAFPSPMVINWASAIISVLLEKIENKKKKKRLIRSIHSKFKQIPNTGLIDVWLQRISKPLDTSITYKDKLTKAALGDVKNSELWCCLWLKKEIINIIDLAEISDFKKRIEEKSISPVIQRREVELFKNDYF